MAPAGLIFAMAESFLLGEVSQIFSMDSHNVGPSVGYYIGFASINLVIYNFIPYFLARAGATLMNIGNLTTSVWSMLFDIILFNGQFKWFYLVGFMFQILSIILFSLRDPLKRVDEQHHESNLVNTSIKPSSAYEQFDQDKSAPLIEIDSDKVFIVIFYDIFGMFIDI